MKASGLRVGRSDVSLLDGKLARNFAVCVILAFLGVAVQVAECYWLWAHGGESDAACEVLKLCSSFLTIWLLFFLFVYYRRKFELLKATNSFLEQDTLGSSGLLATSFLPEALLYLVHAPPFFVAEMSISYYDLRHSALYTTTLNTDELAAVFSMFARSLLLVRCTPYLSGLTVQHNRAYANLNHLTISTWLALRMTYSRNPVRLLGTVSVLLLGMVGFALQVAERRANHDLDNYANCVWLALVSMTSIGFGDLYPMTPFGRLATALAFVWGALLAALTVMTVMRQFELTEAENRVQNMIGKTHSRAVLKQRAAFYIQAAWSVYLERLQRSQSSLESSGLMGLEPLHGDPKFCRSMRAFREQRKETIEPDNIVHLIFKEVLDSRSRVELRLRDLEEKLEEMDSKFEHNIGAMNELLQKNLKYLKHLA